MAINVSIGTQNSYRSFIPKGFPGKKITTTRNAGLSKDIWSPYLLNTRSFIEIYTEPFTKDNFKGAEIASQGVIDLIAKGVGYSYGLSTKLGMAIETFVQKHGNDIKAVLGSVNDNGGYLSFKSFITKYPDLGISNTYEQKNILSKLTNFATNIGESVGGLSPNMQLNFQIPEMWTRTTFNPLIIESRITAHSLEYMPVTPAIDVSDVPLSRENIHNRAVQSRKSYNTNTNVTNSHINELSVMNAALVALMIGAPRQAFSKYTTSDTGTDTIIKSPAVVDVAINGILFPTLNITNVDVKFDEPDTAVFGPMGFPLAATVTWQFAFPLLPTREDFNKLRNALYAYSPDAYDETNVPQLSMDTGVLNTGRS